MSDDALKELTEAAKADQEKALAIVAAMDKLYEEIWGEGSTTDR